MKKARRLLRTAVRLLMRSGHSYRRIEAILRLRARNGMTAWDLSRP